MSGYVYFIVADEVEPRCKIGFTKGHPIARLRALQCGSPVKLSLLGFTKSGIEGEALFHNTFAPLNLHGEWFRIDGKLRDFLAYVVPSPDFEGGLISDERFFEGVRDIIVKGLGKPEDEDEASYGATVDPRPLEGIW